MANMNSVDAVEMDDEVLTLECDDCGEQTFLVHCSTCGESECANCRFSTDCVTKFGASFNVHYV